MIISAIVAKSKNNVIGADGQIPWYLPADLKYFKRTTLHHHIIMGRKTFQSIGHPLPKRTNIVLTKDPFFIASGALVVHSLDEALEIGFENGADEVFIIGGGAIYELAMPICTRLYVTDVDTEVQGDAFFPEISPDTWTLKSQEAHESDDRHAFRYTFKVYERMAANELSGDPSN